MIPIDSNMSKFTTTTITRETVVIFWQVDDKDVSRVVLLQYGGEEIFLPAKIIIANSVCLQMCYDKLFLLENRWSVYLVCRNSFLEEY